LARLARLRQAIQNQNNLLGVAQHECEQYANNAITYFVAGENRYQQIDDLNRAQRRLAFLDRLVAGIESLAGTTERHLALESPEDVKTSTPSLTYSDWEEVLDLRTEFADLEPGEALDEDLSRESEELQLISQRVRTLKTGVPAVLLRLHEKRMNWLLERKTLLETIREKENTVREVTGSSRMLSASNEAVSRVQLLGRLLGSVEERSPNDPIRARAQSRFIQMMLKSIQGRRDRMKTYQANIDSHTMEYESMTQVLMERFRLPAPGLDATLLKAPEVRGRFDQGVVLCSERYLLNESSAPRNSVRITEDSGDEVRRYRRQDTEIVDVLETAAAAT